MKSDLPEVTRSVTVATGDGAFVSVSETIDRLELVISIQRDSQMATARLNKAEFDAICQARYELECHKDKEKEGEIE